jgi:carbon-monoxide dehydrogenase medium subunit
MTTIHEPATVEESVRLLAQLGGEGGPLAGGTWVMREPTRPGPYVALRAVAELRGVRASDGEVRIGAMTTHAEIAALEGHGPALAGLVEAARRSAFPAVRNVATLGGNLAAPFPEADLVPPLLAAGATLELASAAGASEVSVEDWAAGERPAGALIVAARVPVPAGRHAAFERLTVRATAEYSLVSVAVSADLDGGAIAEARVAVGAAEPAPRRVPEAEAALAGRAPDAAAGEAAGAAAREALAARDGLDAPGWYRLEVLPALLGRALDGLGGPR